MFIMIYSFSLLRKSVQANFWAFHFFGKQYRQCPFFMESMKAIIYRQTPKISWFWQNEQLCECVLAKMKNLYLYAISNKRLRIYEERSQYQYGPIMPNMAKYAKYANKMPPDPIEIDFFPHIFATFQSRSRKGRNFLFLPKHIHTTVHFAEIMKF